MPDSIAMEARLAALESRLATVEQRLDALESGKPAESTSTDERLSPGFGAGSLSRASTLIGRVLLIFGGAYLLRAITDFELVPTVVGISLGATYTLLWLFLAYRKGNIQGQRAVAMFYGGACVLLMLPLIVEAGTRFALLSGQQGTVALTIFCALALLVAATRNLQSLCWLVIAGGIATAFALLNATRAAVPASIFLILLGLGSLWAVYVRGWLGPQWLGALGANAGVVVLLLLSGSEQWSVPPLLPYLLGGAMLVAYLASFALRSHVRGHDVGGFETSQAVLAIGIVFWAASKAAQSGELALSTVGVVCLLLGSCAYALAFTPETRALRGRNFYFYSILGLGLVVAGTALMLSPPLAAAVWSLMALALALLSGRTGRVALSLQCTFLLLAAGVASGLLATGLDALVGSAVAAWPPLVTWHLIIALTTVACLFIPVAQHSDRWGVLAGVPQLIVLALSVWEVGGLMVVYLAPIVAGTRGPEPDLAVLAALRTAVLSAASVTLALSSRFRRWPEARWLVYPVLLLVGIKLVLEDFPHGQPATLFVALALVGGALLLVARLLTQEKIEA